MIHIPIYAALAAPALAVNVQRDIEFARPGGISLKLDASIPEGAGPFPAAIVVHGGGWVAGDKAIEWVQPLFAPLEKAGFAWFSINYRVTPQAPYPAMIHDTEAAIVWVKAHAREYKIDPARIALIGESAGGHIVAYVAARSRPETRVAAVVDFYGPHDFLRQVADRDNGDSARLFKNLFQTAPGADGEAKLREASPITYVKKGMPPFLFIHGTDDKSVPVNQSPLMCERMRAVGAACEVYLIDGAPHGMSNWEKTPAYLSYKSKMIDWLTANMR